MQQTAVGLQLFIFAAQVICPIRVVGLQVSIRLRNLFYYVL